MPTRNEELGIKLSLDTSEAEAAVAAIESRVDALVAKLGGAGAGPAGSVPASMPGQGLALSAGIPAAAYPQQAPAGYWMPGPHAGPGASAPSGFGTGMAFAAMGGIANIPRVVASTTAAAQTGAMDAMALRMATMSPDMRRFASSAEDANRSSMGHPSSAGMADVMDRAKQAMRRSMPNPAPPTPPLGADDGPRTRGGSESGHAWLTGPDGSMFPALSGATQGARRFMASPLARGMGASFASAAATSYITDEVDAYLSSYRTETSAQVRRIQTGRAPQPWDNAVARRQRETNWLDATATGLATAAGFVIGEVAVPGIGGFVSGPALGATVHSWINGATNAAGEREQQFGEANFTAEAAARDLALSTGQGVHWNSGAPMSSVDMLKARRNLSLGLMGGHGQGGAALAGRLSSVAVTAAGNHPELAAEWIQRLSTGLDAFTSPLVNSGSYSPDALFALAQKSPDAAQTYATLHGKSGDLAGALEKAQGLVRQAKTIEGAAHGIAGAEADVRGVTARGGDASQIGRAMDAEIAAVGRAKSENDKYIASLESIKNKTVEQSAELERAKAAAAGFTATISEIRYAATRMRSDEAIDVAGTRSSVSGARLPERLAGARRGDTSLYNAALDDLSGEADTIANELKRPGLKPEDRRRLKRQQAQTRAELFGMERESADYVGGEGSRFADLTAQGASLWGRLAALNMGDPEAIARTNRNVSWRQGEAMWQSSGYLSFMRSNPRYYSDEAIKAQENVVLANKVGFAESAITAGAAPFTSGMSNELEGLDLETRMAARNGGSLAAIGVAGKQKGFWSNRIGAINRAADEQVRITPQFRTAIMDRRNADLLGANNALFALDDLEGVYSPDPELSMRYENANAEYRLQLNDVFRPGNRREASMARLAPVRTMIEQVQAQMEGATPANRARLTRTLNALHIEESEIGRSETEGWMGRVLSYESSRPSHAALFAPTYKDLIRFRPDAGRMFGAGDRESAERMRDRRVYGQSDASNRPGDSGAQALKLIAEPVKVTFEMRMPDGSTQKQTAAIRFQVQGDPRQRALAERAR